MVYKYIAKLSNKTNLPVVDFTIILLILNNIMIYQDEKEKKIT